MGFIRTRREPLVPPIPEEKDMDDYFSERKWRVGHATALRDLQASVRKDLEEGGYRLEERTPSSAADVGDKGEVCYDSSYIYVCIATNTWKRVAIATW